MRSRGRTRLASLPLALALLGGLVFAGGAASETTESCKDGEREEVELGIVRASGCWTVVDAAGGKVYTARWEDQVNGVDLNGFILTGEPGAGLQIDLGNRHVAGIALKKGASPKVQLNSANWPEAGVIRPMGDPIALEFVAPEETELLIEDLVFGSNEVARALGGLSPVGEVETPIRLEDDGKGSMDLTIKLGGLFTLKGHPQSATIALPTEIGKGTTLDGFELKLEELDAFEVITVNDLEASYSAEKKLIAGGATGILPFTRVPGKSYGFGLDFEIENGIPSHVGFSVRGVHFPIGEPPAGFVTGFGGGLTAKVVKDGSEIALDANMIAELGAEVPTPWGKVAPVEVDADTKIGVSGKEFFFLIRGGVKIFRLPVGQVYFALHTSSGVEFGVAVGIGFPSYSNNEHDPFYIGAHVDGWFAKRHFQLEGAGRVALFGAKIFDGRILVNDKGSGACWVVLGFPGGAVYEYGWKKVKTFGIGCGLDSYKEKFPGGARVSATSPRTFHLTAEEGVIEVKGAGGAPRFALRSGGRVLRAPVESDSAIVRSGVRHAFFVNEGTDTTNVVIARPQGDWTVVPYPGSPPVVGVRAAREAPKEHVTAEVTGRGPVRTLHWDSLNRPHTRLLFLERLRSGQEVPLFQTDRPRGARQFHAVTGAHYGRRQIRVVVIHGYASRQDSVVESYRVARPRPVDGPQEVSAWRDDHDVHVRWNGVRAAHGYLVQIAIEDSKGGQLTSFMRRVPARQRSLVIPNHPGSGNGTAVARVFSLNRDGRPGQPTPQPFATGPGATALPAAVRRGASAASRRGHSVLVRSVCPRGPHCQVVAELRLRGRTVARRRLQQTPDTFHTIRLTPRLRVDRRALRAGGPMRVVLRVRRAGRRVARLAPLQSPGAASPARR